MNLFYNIIESYIIQILNLYIYIYLYIFLGRVTRARRNMNKNSTSPDTSQRYREARKRIHSIVDSDSE